MKQYIAYKSCGIPDKVLDGIHSTDTTLPEETSSENGKEKKVKPMQYNGLYSRWNSFQKWNTCKLTFVLRVEHQAVKLSCSELEEEIC